MGHIRNSEKREYEPESEREIIVRVRKLFVGKVESPELKYVLIVRIFF